MRKCLILLTILIIQILCLSFINVNTVNAELNYLDTTFSGDGVTKFYRSTWNYGSSNNHGIKIDKNGKYVFITEGRTTGPYFNGYIGRYNQDGSYDTTFNGVGFKWFNSAVFSDLVIDSDNRYIIGGNYEDQAALFRILPDGSLDSTFGTNGIIKYNTPTFDFRKIYSIIEDSNGNYIVTGNSPTRGIIPIIKIKNDGSLDTTFGVNGYVQSTYDGAHFLYDIQISGENIIAVGGAYIMGVSSAYELYIVKLTHNGDLDNNFNTNGTIYFGRFLGGSGNEYLRDCIIDQENNLFATGWANNTSGNTDMVLLKIKPNGELDNSFGNNGVVVQHNTAGGNLDDRGNKLIIDVNNRIIVVGRSDRDSTHYNLTIWRFLPNGSLDTTFNDTGYITDQFASSGLYNSSGVNIFIDSKGRYVISGENLTGVSSGSREGFIARFENLNQIRNLPTGITPYINNIDVSYGTSNGVYGESKEVIFKQNSILIAKSIVDMTMDRDLSTVGIETNVDEKKAIVHELTNVDGVGDKYDLYIPKGESDNVIGICPSAESISEVNNQCEGLIYKILSDEGVYEETIEDIDYWLLKDLSSTGAFSLEDINPPEVNKEEGSINVYSGQVVEDRYYPIRMKIGDDISGVDEVDLYIDNELVCEDIELNKDGYYECLWDTDKYHTDIMVRMYDRVGNMSEFEVLGVNVKLANTGINIMMIPFILGSLVIIVLPKFNLIK